MSCSRTQLRPGTSSSLDLKTNTLPGCMPPFLYVFVCVDTGVRPKSTKTLLKPQWDPGAVSAGYIIHELFQGSYRQVHV